MTDGALFPASAVARLSAGVCAPGVFVETVDGVQGRIVASDAVHGSTERWWLVRLATRPPVVRRISESRLRVRS